MAPDFWLRAGDSRKPFCPEISLAAGRSVGLLPPFKTPPRHLLALHDSSKLDCVRHQAP